MAMLAGDLVAVDCYVWKEDKAAVGGVASVEHLMSEARRSFDGDRSIFRSCHPEKRR